MTEPLPQYQPGQEHSQIPPNITENEKSNPFVCNVCKRNYSRVDHLARHYRSHTREKPFSCSTCGKNFARADLLKRHANCHSGDKRDSKRHQPASAQLTRVAQACSACASAKLRCGHEKPCKRCLQKGIPCTFPPGSAKNGGTYQRSQGSEGSSSNQTPPMIHSEMEDQPMHMGESHNQMYHYPDPHQQSLPMQIPGTNTFSQNSNSMPLPGPPDTMDESVMTMQTTTMNEDPILDMDDSSLAEFLRDIMMPPSPDSLINATSIQQYNPPVYSSRDVFNFGIDSSLEFNDIDFGWITSQTDRAQNFNYNMLPEQGEPTVNHVNETADVDSSITLGAEAFQKSLWNWLPTTRDHVFNETTSLALAFKDLESLENRVASDVLDHQLEQSSRDGILAMLLTTRSKKRSMSKVVTSFPSAQLLDGLMHLFFRSEITKTDSWIHIPTFRPQSNLPELNGIIVAAGAILSSVPTVRKLGYGIQEAVRLALPDIFEDDNSRTRELELLQTYAIELSIGIWSGNKRKMEIAESHAQPIITMLRRSGHYRRTRVLPARPSPDDDDKALEVKWRAWIEAESWKRLAFHILIHDAQASISLLTRPLISYAEVSLELPCSQALWGAKTAQEWRDAYNQYTDHPSRLPSLVNCVHDLQPLLKYQQFIDLQHSTSIVLHAIWSLIAEYRQLEFVLKLQTPERHWNGGLISTSWHQELCQLLDHFRINVSEWPGGIRPEQKIIQELFMMNLHVSFEELQLFAGKEGNEEAQRVYPLLKTWFENRKSRQAVWHAGQVLRAALSFPPNQLRNFYAVAVYHASLAFWVYGMVSLGSTRSRHRHTHPSIAAMVIAEEEHEQEFIYLDGEDTPEARRFIAISRGIPVIQIQEPASLPSSRNGERQAAGTGVGVGVGGAIPLYARLDNPHKVMDTVLNILSRNCTSGNSALSPLVENLGQLVKDLGNAARIVGR